MPSFTKLYLTTATAPYTPATIRGAWDDTGGAVTRALSPRKEFGGQLTTVARAETNGAANFDVLLYRGVSGPLAAQTISGNLDVVLGIQESSASADFAFHIHVYVTQGDSDTPRGTLLNNYVETTANEWPTTATGRALASAQALSSLAVSAGDRLVVEIGYVALNAVTTSFTGALHYGTQRANTLDVVADLAAAGTDVTIKAGFISFSNAITESDQAARVTSETALALSTRPAGHGRVSSLVALTLTTTSIEARVSGLLALTLTRLVAVPEPEEPVLVSGGIVELGLGGSYRAWITSHGAKHLWSLGDVATTTARDDAPSDPVFAPNGQVGTYVGDPVHARGLLPEYGLATFFDGVDDAVEITPLLSNQNAPFSLIVLVRPDATGLGAAQCVVHTGAGAAYLGLSAANKAVFGINGGTLITGTRTLRAGDAYLLIGAYNGDEGRLFVAALDDTIIDESTLTAFDFSAAHNNTPAEIGANDGAAFFTGALQGVAVLDFAIELADVAELHATTQWTDVTTDVEPVLTIDRGIHSDRPETRVAAVGRCTFVLDNSTLNSAALLGYYSPGHANARPGFDRGTPVRVSLPHGSSGETLRVKFLGRVKTVRATPGVYRDRRVHVLAVDWLDEAATATITGLPVQEAVTADVALAVLINGMRNRPHDLDLDVGSDVYPFALHHTQDEESTVLDEAQKLTLSELGLAYVTGNGTFRFENRAARQVSASAAYTIDRLREVQAERAGEQIVNRVRVTVHPGRVDDDPTTVLYTTFGTGGSPAAGRPLAIDHGVPLSIFLPFTDPAQQAVRVGAIEIVEPVPGASLFINSAEDGTGIDLTTHPSLTYAFELGGNGAYLHIENTYGQRVYLAVQLVGRGIYDYQPVTVLAEDRDSIRKEGVSELALDMPYQPSPTVGQEIAQYLLATGLAPGTRVQSATFKMTGDDQLVDAGVNAEISTRVGLLEDMNAIDGEYFINGERLVWRGAAATPEGLDTDDIDVTWWLSREAGLGPGGSGGGAWVLGESALGIDTALA